MIEVSNRRALFAELKDYCHMCGKDGYMEVTEWSNGEGWDVHIENIRGAKQFSLTYGEFDLLQVLLNWKGE